MIQKIIALFLAYLIIQIRGQCSSDPQCLFCSVGTQICILCQDSYYLEVTNKCEALKTCRYYESRGSDLTCKEKCLDNELEVFNQISLENDCKQLFECPLYIPFDASKTVYAISKGVYQNQGRTFKILIQRLQYSVNLIDLDSGITLEILQTSLNNDDMITDFIYQQSTSGSMGIVAWSQQLKGIVLTTSSSKQYKLEGFNLSLNSGDIILQSQIIWINGEASKLRFLIQDASQNLLLSDFDLNLRVIQLIASFSPVSQSLASLSNIQLNNISTITGSAVETISISKNISFSLILDSSNIIQYHRLCELNSQSYSQMFLQQYNEVFYYSPTDLLGSSLTSCFNPQILISSTNGKKPFIDELNGNLYSIDDSKINIYDYSVQIGMSTLTASSIPSLNNVTNKISSCYPFLLSTLETDFLCIDVGNTNIFLMKRQFGILTSELIYTHSEIILFFNVDIQDKQIIIQSQQKLIIAPQIESLQTLKVSIGCLHQIQDEMLSTTQEWAGKVAIINNSVANSNSITGRRLIFSLSDEQSSRIDMITNLIGFFQIILQPKASSTYVFGFDAWISKLKYPSLKIRYLDCSVNNNITFDIEVKEIIFESLKFQQSIDSTVITIDSKNVVIFRDILLQNMDVKRTIPFVIMNCQNISFSSLIIKSVNFVDQTSGLINIKLSDKLQLNSIHISGSSSNNIPLINVAQINFIHIISPTMISHKFDIQNSGSNSVPYASLVNIMSATQVIIQNADIQQNTNTLSIRVAQKYITEELDNFFKKSSSVIVSGMLIDSNIATGHSQVSIQAQMFLADSIICRNNVGNTSYGSLYVENADSYITMSQFNFNTALSGGGIYFNQTSSVLIYASKFLKNKAIAAGGGFLIYNAQALLKKTEIVGNSAMIGGGVRIDQGWYNDVTWDSECIISGNSATLYGKNVVSRLTRREFLVNGKNMTQVEKSEINAINQQISLYQPFYNVQNALFINELRSGATVQILIRLYDKDNVRLVFNPLELKNFPEIIQEEINHLICAIDSLTMGIVGEFYFDKFSVEQQGFLSEELVIYGSPLVTLPIIVLENYVEFDKSDYVGRRRQLKQSFIRNNSLNELTIQDENEEEEVYLSKTNDEFSESLEVFEFKFDNANSKNLPDGNMIPKRSLLDLMTTQKIMRSKYLQESALLLQFRQCINGEILNKINDEMGTVQCFPCPINSYTLVNNEPQCEKCPDTAFLCQNMTIVLKNGYWRENILTDEIYQCDMAMDFCQEESQILSRSQCKQGSIGPLCEGCDQKGTIWGERFTRSSNRNCDRCDTIDRQILYLILMFVLTTSYLFYGVNMAVKANSLSALGYYVRRMGFLPILNSSSRTKSGSYTKLLTHYLQIFAVINTVQIQLPVVLGFLPKIAGNPSTSLTLSSSCLINMLDTFDSMRASVIEVSIVPLIYLCSGTIVYAILCFTKVIKTFERQFIFTAAIFLTIFFQPDCVMYLISAIGCTRLGKHDYLLADPNYKCYSTNNYYSFLIYFTIPSLIIWCVGPLFILFQLRKRRNQLELTSTRKIFGYLYLEFKPQFYYFEFIRSLCKILIVVIFTISNLAFSLKFDIIAIIIFAYIIFSNTFQPFQNKRLGMVDGITHFVIFLETFFQILVTNFSNNFGNFGGSNYFTIQTINFINRCLGITQTHSFWIKYILYLRNDMPDCPSQNPRKRGVISQDYHIHLKQSEIFTSLSPENQYYVQRKTNLNPFQVETSSRQYSTNHPTLQQVHLIVVNQLIFFCKLDRYKSQNKYAKKDDEIKEEKNEMVETELVGLLNQQSSSNQVTITNQIDTNRPIGCIDSQKSNENQKILYEIQSIPQEEQDECEEFKPIKNNDNIFKQYNIAFTQTQTDLQNTHRKK